MKKEVHYLITAILIIATISCNKNFEATIPSYIEITDFKCYANENDSILDSLKCISENITNIWISSNSVSLGAFELPCRIPVLESGEKNIRIYPGVNESGQQALRVRYPFYTDYNINATLIQDSAIIIEPLTSYTQYYFATWRFQCWLEI